MPNEIYHRSNWGESKAEDFGDVYYDHAATNKLYNHSDYYENSDGTDATLKDLSNKASIVLTPTAYSDGSLNTVIPPYQVLPTELVTNGDFSNGSTGWTHNNLSGTSTFSVSNNELTFTRGTFGDSFYQTDVAPAVAGVYLLTFDVTAISGGSLRYSFSPNSAANTSNRVSANSVGSYSTSFVSDGTLLDFVFDLDSNGASVTIDNVSVKKVQEADFDFSRGSSATRVNEQGLVEDVQILSGELVQNGNFEQIGSELVTNGDFDTDSDWSNSGSWSIGNGVATYDGLLNIKRIYQTVNFVQNKIYKISFDITNTVDDYIDLFFGQDATTLIGRTDYAVGSYEFYVTATSTSQNLSIYAYNTSYGGGSIDNVSVKEVGQDWTFGTGWSMGDGKAIGDGTMVSNVLEQDYDFIDGSLYRFTFTIKDYVSGSLFIRQPFNGSSDAVSANGTYTFDYVAGSTNSLKFRGNSFIGSIDDVSFKLVTNDTDLPRIDYTDGTGSLLLEPQSTNLMTYSEDFSEWTRSTTNIDTPSNVTQTNPSGGSESGFININNGVSATKFIYKSISTTSSIHTQSVFFKYHSRQWVQLLSGGTSHYANFDIQNGAVGNVSGCTATIQDYGSGWYKCTATLLSVGTPINMAVAVLDDDATSRLPNSTGTGSYYVWGAQVEQLSYATSYIPTSGSTVTRSADVANNSGNADLFNDSEGVLYAEVAALANDGTNRAIAISDGTTSNVVRFYYSVTDNRIVGNVKSSGSNVFSYNNVLTDATDFIKVAVSYKANDFKMYVDGLQVSTDTSGAVPTGLVELAFDNGASADDFLGKTKAVAVFKEALSNDLLERLTGEGYESFRLLAEANNYTII